MSNHPKRNWQRRMHDACDLWLTQYRWPEGGAQLIPVVELRELLRAGYTRGYRDGRDSNKTR